MEFKIHEDAIEEIQELTDEEIKVVKQRIESRQNRENTILDQRGTGISYDNHGEPVHYFKVQNDVDFRVLFDILDGKVLILGTRRRNDLTYLNLREYTKRK